jgi:PAS domain S-box-containing protein/putative nucleotidyltransferase with HDIG domain
MKILIAEDDFTTCTILTEMLTKQGHEVVVTVNGAEAWAALQQPDAPRLAILDWMMTEMNGIEVCRRVCTLETDDPPYIIILTAKGEKADIIAGLEAGANDYLAKPFDLGEFHARINVGRRMVELQAAMANKVRQLQESEERLREVLENSLDASYKRSLQTNAYDYLSPVFARISGYTPDEMKALPIETVLGLMHPDDRVEIERVIAESMSGAIGTAYQLEYRFKHKEGQYRWFHDQFTVVRNAGGHPLAHIGSVRDITEHKRAEEALVFSNIILRTQQESSIDGILVVDEKGEILSLNQRFVDLWGIPPDVIESKSDERALQSVMDKLASPEEFIRKVKHLYEVRDEISRDETFLKDGRSFDRYSAPMLGADRKYYGRVWYFRDITERKQAEEELKQTLEKLRKSLTGTIQAMSLTVETRDPYTAGHQRKVSNLARTIAQEMGLSSDTVDTIRMAGIIHDIGKISVPAEILVKPGKITDIEMSLIKAHSQTGYDILKDVGLPYPIAEIVFQHHERLDGSGYPQGLKDGQILLEARIVSVADVVEAISSHRPYRPGFGIDVALEEIEKNKDILYDAEAVEVCVKLFREKEFSFE